MNPSVEVFVCADKSAMIVGDRSIALSGTSSRDFYNRLKSVFSEPLEEAALAERDPAIYAKLADLLKTDILMREGEGHLDFFGTSSIHDAIIQNLEQVDRLQRKDILICFPEARGLLQQQQAQKALKENQVLLTGFYKGTTLFVLPLITGHETDICSLCLKLLSAEEGTANLYFSHELMEERDTAKERKPLRKDVVRWVAADIAAMLNANNILNESTAYVYRGTFVKKETIDLTKTTAHVGLQHSDEENILELEKTLVGPGRLITRVNVAKISNSPRPYFSVQSRMARPNLALAEEEEGSFAAGVGDTITKAKVRSFMEAVERSSIEGYRMEDQKLCRESELDIPIIDWREVSGLSDDDHFEQLDSLDEVRAWVTAERLSDRSAYAVPLELARYPVLFNEKTKYIACDTTTSSGCAAHFSREEAIRSAAYELIERDAFLIAWLRKASPFRIDVASLPTDLKEELDGIAKVGISARIIELTTDLAPVISVLLSREGEAFRYSVGCASHNDPYVALLKALNEALAALTLSTERPRPHLEVLEHINLPKDHIELYASGKYDDLLMRLYDSGETKKFSEIKTGQSDIIQHLIDNHYEIFVADLTSPEVKAIAPNISVIKAFIPGLVPIQFGKYWPRTRSQRIMRIPEAMGWKVQALCHKNLERFPHPFP